jgi:hypothetical protein
VHTPQENNKLPIITWRHMKEVMRARFVPHNYLCSVFDKLQQLKQGSMFVNEYYMEMEMLLQLIRITPAILGVLSRSFTASQPGYKSSNNANNVT